MWNILHACVYMCHMHSLCLQSQKKALDLLELELQSFMNCYVLLGIEFTFSGAISPALCYIFKIKFTISSFSNSLSTKNFKAR